MIALIGHERIPDYSGDHVEATHWIGKPWRRITLLVNEFYWKGELAERSWDLSFHLGSRRLGFAISIDLIRQPAMDYSEERP